MRKTSQPMPIEAGSGAAEIGFGSGKGFENIISGATDLLSQHLLAAVYFVPVCKCRGIDFGVELNRTGVVLPSHSLDRTVLGSGQDAGALRQAADFGAVPLKTG